MINDEAKRAEARIESLIDSWGMFIAWIVLALDNANRPTAVGTGLVVVLFVLMLIALARANKYRRNI